MKTGGRKSRGFESHPLRHALLTAIAALLLAGCTLLGGVRTFGVSFPAEDGLQDLPVLLTDSTGLVTGLDLPDRIAMPVDTDVAQVPGNPNAILIQWIGGACDESVDITTGAAAVLTLTLKTTVRSVECDAIGINRTLVVTFSRPITAAEVLLDVAR